MKLDRLADTQEIRKIESRFVNLISRTFLKGALYVPASQIPDSVKKSFSSKTYEIQLDKIIDDIYIASVDYADRKTEELGGTSSGSAQASRGAAATLEAAKDKPLPITEEAIKQTRALTGDAAESVTRWLKDNDLYTQHPDQLARQVKDLWDGQKYKARRFAVTFTADLAENTAIHRYNDLGITYLQFFAEIDEKTTPQCRAFHGTIIKTDTRDIEKYRPPLHHHCRSALIPATSKVLKDNQDLLIENRDFTKQLNQEFKPFPGRVDSDEIKGVFEEIGKFNDKYRIDQFILDEDLQLRLMKLKLDIYTEIPGKGKTKLDDFLKPEKPEPPKPKYLTGQEIRENIPEAKGKYERAIQNETNLLEELSQERTTLRAKHDKISNELLEKIDKDIIKIDSPEYREGIKQLEDIGKQLDINDNKFSEAMRRRTALFMKDKEVIRELLYIDDGQGKDKLFTYSSKKPSKERINQAEKARDFFNRVTIQEIRDNTPEIKIIERGRARAKAALNKNEIILGSKDDTDTILHELGHHIEYQNPEIYQSAKSMYDRRTEGEKLERLRDITGIKGYKRNEVTRKDKFFSPYMGKDYGKGNEFTEAVSMGIQYLYKDPEWLAKTDPETFDWIINTLRGNYG